jgi:hypothetical protein
VIFTMTYFLAFLLPFGAPGVRGEILIPINFPTATLSRFGAVRSCLLAARLIAFCSSSSNRVLMTFLFVGIQVLHLYRVLRPSLVFSIGWTRIKAVIARVMVFGVTLKCSANSSLVRGSERTSSGNSASRAVIAPRIAPLVPCSRVGTVGVRPCRKRLYSASVMRLRRAARMICSRSFTVTVVRMIGILRFWLPACGREIALAGRQYDHRSHRGAIIALAHVRAVDVCGFARLDCLSYHIGYVVGIDDAVVRERQVATVAQESSTPLGIFDALKASDITLKLMIFAVALWRMPFSVNRVSHLCISVFCCWPFGSPSPASGLLA